MQHLYQNVFKDRQRKTANLFQNGHVPALKYNYNVTTIKSPKISWKESDLSFVDDSAINSLRQAERLIYRCVVEYDTH